jgi:hypothetical protein
MIAAMRSSAAVWAERVHAWRESGQHAAEFAAGKDFTERTLKWWAGELARRARPKPGVKMARVVAVAKEAEALAIAAGGATIVLRRGFDAELLRQVVVALAGPR